MTTATDPDAADWLGDRRPVTELSTDELTKVLAARAEADLAGLEQKIRIAEMDLAALKAELAERRRVVKAFGGVADPGSHDCKLCDRSFDTKQGLRMHTTRTHRDEIPPLTKVTKKTTAAAPPDDEADDPGEGRLRCACLKRFETVQHLTDHCRHVHGRTPTREERTPAPPLAAS